MIRALILASAGVVGACGGSSQKPAAEPIANIQPAQTPTTSPPMNATDRVLAALERFERDMCACAPKDSACAQRVSDEMTTWSQEQAANAGASEPAHMTEAQTARATKIGTHMGECMQAAMGS
jgi:hypothetical protein